MSTEKKVYISTDYTGEAIAPHQYFVTDADGKGKWEDRPHYEETAVIQLIPETQFTVDEDGMVFLTSPIGLVVGETYSFTWNGTVYECSPITMTEEGITMVLAGNYGSAMGGTDTGEPFAIMEYPPAMGAAQGTYGIIIAVDGSTQFTITVEKAATIIHKLDKKYLPQTDWDAAPDADGYIANRTHYVNSIEKELLPETTISNLSSELTPAYVTLSEELETGMEYEITWNGTTYTCSGTTDFYASYCSVAFGNVKGLSGDDTGEPFLFGVLSAEYQEQLGTKYVVWSYDGTTSATLRIVKPAGAVRKLDPQFIPHIPCELNFVNGIASGSVRTKSASSDGNIVVDGEKYYLGEYAFAEGLGSRAWGEASHAEGYSTEARGSRAHAEGAATDAIGDESHAEGNNTTANGSFSHAEGRGTTANSFSSHAEGDYTTANGSRSHAEGNYTIANGIRSHAEGNYTIASSADQHVQGQFNIEDTAGTYAHIVGNGDSTEARSNAHTLDWSGNAWYQGYVEGAKLILPSPNGTRWAITVGNDGTLNVAAADAQ